MEIGLNDLMTLVSVGVIAGLLSGILGIGGGLLIVPLLQFIFSSWGMEQDVLVRMSTATSLVIIIATSIINAVTHYRDGNVDMKVIKQVGPFLVLGTFIGVSVATYLNGSILYLIFNISLFFVSLNMLFGTKSSLIEGEPKMWMIGGAGTFIGTFSSILGLGAASIGVPTFTLLNFPIRKAIGNITMMSIIVALPSSILFLWAGISHDVNLPHSIGYINYLVVLILAPVTAFFVPFGVKIGKKMNQVTLKRAFALFILSISLRPVYKYVIEYFM